MRRVWLVGLALALGALSAHGQDSEFGWRKLGETAPGLNIDVLYGEPVKLADGVGKHVYIIEFWATWCGPCKFSMPHLSAIQEKYRDQGLVVIGISDESEEQVRPYIDGFDGPIRHTIAVDRVRTTVSRYMSGYGQEGIPVAFVIDANGRVVWIGNPASPFMEKLVVTLLEDLSKDEESERSEVSEEGPEPPVKTQTD